ncbi:hypothetical protein ADK55_25060 [Streptomyces sp. WM4235]|nr:hypothetical protein ADK55_25060 [Streptomyces sp. WM4235]
MSASEQGAFEGAQRGVGAGFHGAGGYAQGLGGLGDRLVEVAGVQEDLAVRFAEVAQGLADQVAVGRALRVAR